MNHNHDEIIEQTDFSERCNIAEFFALLLKIDKRIHPERYQKDNNNIE
jgi:hypothetical protein